MRNRIISSVIIILFVSLFSILCFTSCSSSEQKAAKIATDTCNDLMHHIEEGDKGGIKELFCPYIQNDPDLEKQIDKIFEIIDSPVSSIGEIDITSSRESIRDGKTVKYYVTVTQGPVLLLNGKKYLVSFGMNTENKNNSLIGI